MRKPGIYQGSGVKERIASPNFLAEKNKSINNPNFWWVSLIDNQSFTYESSDYMGVRITYKIQKFEFYT